MTIRIRQGLKESLQLRLNHFFPTLHSSPMPKVNGMLTLPHLSLQPGFAWSDAAAATVVRHMISSRMSWSKCKQLQEDCMLMDVSSPLVYLTLLSLGCHPFGWLICLLKDSVVFSFSSMCSNNNNNNVYCNICSLKWSIRRNPSWYLFVFLTGKRCGKVISAWIIVKFYSHRVWMGDCTDNYWRGPICLY